MLMMISVVQCHCLPIYNNIDRGLEGEEMTHNSSSLFLITSTQNQRKENNNDERATHYHCV